MKLLVFWKTIRSGGIVGYELWSQPEVRLYLQKYYLTKVKLEPAS